MLILSTIALVLAAAVTLVTNRILRNRLEPSNDMTHIVVAAQGVSVGSRLSEADLRLAPWPRAVPLKGSFQNIADVIGRGVVVPMISNEPILESKLAPTGSGAGLTAAIPDGMRAVGVKVNDVIGVAGFVVPGSRVDVILSGSPGKEGEVEMSKVILENIQVLAAGQNVATDGNGKPQNVQVVTLLVTPQQSQKLALASVDGNIQLALRNPLDRVLENPDAVRREGLYGSSLAPSTPAPVPSPAVKRAPVRPPKPSEPPASIAVVAPVVVPVPPAAEKVELQLIQGAKSEKLTFEKKPTPIEEPVGQ
jgi:pilus assembly protein CpaB